MSDEQTARVAVLEDRVRDLTIERDDLRCRLGAVADQARAMQGRPVGLVAFVGFHEIEKMARVISR